MPAHADLSTGLRPDFDPSTPVDVRVMGCTCTPHLDFEFVAAEDLRGKIFRFVTLAESANNVKLCGDCDLPIGVLQNAPAAGEAATVRLLGASLVVVRGGVRRGAYHMFHNVRQEMDTAERIGIDCGSGPATFGQPVRGMIVTDPDAPSEDAVPATLYDLARAYFFDSGVWWTETVAGEHVSEPEAATPRPETTTSQTPTV